MLYINFNSCEKDIEVILTHVFYSGAINNRPIDS